MLFIEPVPADRLSQIYPPNYYSYAVPEQSFVHRLKDRLDRRFFAKVLEGISGDALRIIDVGGGAGWELNALRAGQRRVAETWIVDLDPHAADIARRNGHLYFCGRIEDFETEDQFDVVILFNLIEHVRDPGRVLRKLEAILKPGGVVIVKTPNYDSWDARLFKHRNWAGYHCPRHWVLFTRDSFARLAASAGFEIRQSSYTQGAAFWSASVVGCLAELGLLHVTQERPIFYHPLFRPLAAGFAAVDFSRRAFAKTSQMFFVLAKPSADAGMVCASVLTDSLERRPR